MLYLLNGAVLTGLILFFVLSIAHRHFKSALVISAFYSTVAQAIGQENFKAAVSLLLMLFTLVSSISFKKSTVEVTSAIRKISNTPLIVSMIALSCYILLSSIFSTAIGTDYHLQKLTFFFVLTVFPLFVISLTEGDEKDHATISTFFIIISILLALKQIFFLIDFGIVNYLSAVWLPRFSEGINSIWLGRFLSLGIVFLFQRMLDRWSLLKLTGILTLLFGILLTGSKASLFFSAVGVLCLLATRFLSGTKLSVVRKKNLYFSVLSLLLVSIVTVVLLYSINPVAFERRFSRDSPSIKDRQLRIENVIRDWKESERSIIGEGFATVGLSLSGAYIRDYPHNITAEVLYELGLIGLFLYYFPFTFLLLKLRELVNSGFADYIVALLIFLLHAQVSGDLMSNEVPFLILALTVSQSFSGKKSTSLHHSGS